MADQIVDTEGTVPVAIKQLRAWSIALGMVASDDENKVGLEEMLVHRLTHRTPSEARLNCHWCRRTQRINEAVQQIDGVLRKLDHG